MKIIGRAWWKILAVLLMIYTIVAGFLAPIPALPILNESIRNLHFHVTMWFGMLFLFAGSVINSVRYLINYDLKYDDKGVEMANTGILFGIMGLITGMLWARVTWGEYWSSDPQQNMAAIGLLVYLAYFVLRNALEDIEKRARISAIYNVFAFAVLIPLLFVLPRMTDSLHPGSGGNPGFNSYDLDNNLRMVFYPAILGWTLMGFWISSIRIRLRRLNRNLLMQ